MLLACFSCCSQERRSFSSTHLSSNISSLNALGQESASCSCSFVCLPSAAGYEATRLRVNVASQASWKSTSPISSSSSSGVCFVSWDAVLVARLTCRSQDGNASVDPCLKACSHGFNSSSKLRRTARLHPGLDCVRPAERRPPTRASAQRRARFDIFFCILLRSCALKTAIVRKTPFLHPGCWHGYFPAWAECSDSRCNRALEAHPMDLWQAACATAFTACRTLPGPGPEVACDGLGDSGSKSNSSRCDAFDLPGAFLASLTFSATTGVGATFSFLQCVCSERRHADLGFTAWGSNPKSQALPGTLGDVL